MRSRLVALALVAWLGLLSSASAIDGGGSPVAATPAVTTGNGSAPITRLGDDGLFRDGDSSGSRALGAAAGQAGRLRPARLWDRVRETPLVRRVIAIGEWVVSFLRFLWTIPKALIQGDSQEMIAALGDLLARSTPGGRAARGSAAPSPAQEPSQQVLPPSGGADPAPPTP